jgi:hypothetical protein
MNSFGRVAPWITRLIILLPITLLLALGIHFVSHVTAAAGARGIVFASGMGMTAARIGFGAFPLGCGLFLLGCVFSERRLLTALAFVATLDSVVLVIRIASMFSDSTVRQNMRLVGAEVLLLVLAVTGGLIELARKGNASLM